MRVRHRDASRSHQDGAGDVRAVAVGQGRSPMMARTQYRSRPHALPAGALGAERDLGLLGKCGLCAEV